MGIRCVVGGSKEESVKAPHVAVAGRELESLRASQCSERHHAVAKQTTNISSRACKHANHNLIDLTFTSYLELVSSFVPSLYVFTYGIQTTFERFRVSDGRK